MLDIGYALSHRFPDPPQTDYRSADVRALRHDLFCGDVYLADTDTDRELSTAWGWVPVLDFAWALCDIAEKLDRAPSPTPGRQAAAPGSRSPGPYRAELDFTESTDMLRFTRRFGWVEITADWSPDDDREPLAFGHTELRREARDFLHDLVADLTDMHDGLADNPTVWDLTSRYPRTP
ncbi:hypothetical protein [Streptomyces reniochalinae]|uniref:Uncharacterized protein n=1 Tax=Streptomyces reniochalinae TaxID=2250578 RepID=A0A367EK22_9ACTN|nr:hypothetical protein [Streptomyces reniochalinae]RCG18062.1 hypothetical protein DQ392_15450 [Streptomyces reniochalinae]